MPGIVGFMNHNSRRVFYLIIIGGQLVLYFTYLQRFDKRSSDFPSYYSVARIWQRGGNPYDLDSQCAEMIPISGGCAPMAHPPVLLPILSIVSSSDFTTSYWRWIFVQLTASLTAFFVLWRFSGNAPGSAQSLIFFPLVMSIYFGNDTPIVLLGVILWAWLMIDVRRDFLAGLALSLTVIKPQLAIILALPLLFSRPKSFLGFCVGGFALTGLSLAAVGIDGFRGIVEITRIMASGKSYGIYQTGMVNTTGIFARAGLSPFWSWPLYLFAIAATCVFWKHHRGSIATVSLSLIGALFFSPHVHPYDLALLAIPLVFAHRLAPLLASLIMLLMVPFNTGYIGAFILFLPLASIYVRRLTSDGRIAPSVLS